MIACELTQGVAVGGGAFDDPAVCTARADVAGRRTVREAHVDGKDFAVAHRAVDHVVDLLVIEIPDRKLEAHGELLGPGDLVVTQALRTPQLFRVIVVACEGAENHGRHEDEYERHDPGDGLLFSGRHHGDCRDTSVGAVGSGIEPQP